MALKPEIRAKADSLASRWLEATLALFPKDSAAFFRREKDPFANPVGHALRTGTRALIESLIEGIDPDTVCRQLDEVIRVRAIQEATPSQGVLFVFLLKRVLREELAEQARDPRRTDEWLALDQEIDQLALFAFDVYSRCREQIYQLRCNELKRNVSMMVERLHRGVADAPPNGSAQASDKQPIPTRS